MNLSPNKIIYTFLLLDVLAFASCYYVELEGDGPIVKGGTITVNALLYDGADLATGSFQYIWVDNAIPEHSKQNDSKSAKDTWKVTYATKIYPQGPYRIQVKVNRCLLNLYCYEIASNRLDFYINETLNGEISLTQNNQSRGNSFVSSTETVIHSVNLKSTDANFVKNATTVNTYWFVDCTYLGFSNGFTFPYNYTRPDQKHVMEALVVADFTPFVPTTTTTSTTTVTPTTSTKPTTTTPKPTTIPTKHVTKSIIKRDIGYESQQTVSTQHITVNVNGTLIPYNSSFPYICNGTVAIDSNKTYGFFYKIIEVREPVSKVNVTGNNWLQHGDLLTLNVKCDSSKNLKYCVQFRSGIYNVTGNESCSSYHELEICEFMIERFFLDSTQHTIIIIIENEVSKKVTPVTVTVYKVQKQAQLSVIVVPVAFSLVAVVLIVFGVAYYIQNRSRFVVEVADFNFGQNYSDLEYKTFQERLRDSISNAFFTRAPSPGSSEVPVWPPGRKYGSMTS